jgi:PKD repeat protein
MRRHFHGLCGLSLLAACALAPDGPSAADVVVPSSAYGLGRNNAEFHTDVRAFNPSATASVTVTPVFYNQRTIETITGPTVTIGPRQQQAWDNMLATVFGKTLDENAFGPIRFQTNGALLVSTGTNNYNGCQNGSVSGQWIPGIDVGQALKAGTLVQLASSVDLSQGYRTNLVFMNPGAATANASFSVYRGDGTAIVATALDPLPANGFIQINNWRYGTDLGVAGTDDTNLYVAFTSDQPVLAFASVINNGSGDPFAIVATPEPVVPPLAPVVSYSVSASPKASQPVTFTDTSANAPTQQLWAFGDGAIATSGVSALHTYSAAGTYRSAHFVSNAGGSSGTSKDVVVAVAGPVAFTVNAKQFQFDVPAPYAGSTQGEIILHVGTTYTITFKAVDVDPTIHHGAGGLAFTYLSPAKKCDVIPAGATGCTVTITPTAANLNSPGPTYPFNCNASPSCGSGHDGMLGAITIVP